ncbi:hypothetical protein [Demequina sp. NBRC 110053]|uniref:hypothetical protein n=1 Tax=Demequina sp. NBRC 110053 TaxID=1570342 RepID=UPI0009FDE901|nr:hypothetical protein [Demequina sp. NBRC 110053]
MKVALAYAVLAVGGLITASVGAVAHRGYAPWGLVASILMVGLAAVFSRAWLGFTGLTLFAGAWLVATFVWSLNGPGGSVLIVQDALGIAWLAGATMMVVASALVPTRILVGDHGTR